MSIESNENGTVITGGDITTFRLMAFKTALKLEIAGMRHSRGRSISAQVKQELGFKGKRESLLTQLDELIEARRD